MKSSSRNHSYEFRLLIYAFSFAVFISIISIKNASGQNAPDLKTKPAPSPSPAKKPQPSELQKALNEFRIQMGQAGGGGRRKLKTAGKQNSLTGRVSYRLAKVMDNYSSGAAQDPHNLRDEWSLSASDMTHSVQISYTYELPFGKGKKLFNDDDLASRIMAPMLGSWSLSGLTTWRNGAPLIIRPLFNRTGGIVGNLRVNVVPGVDPEAEEQSPQQWFNPAAFAQPDDFTLGDAPRTHPILREPGEQFHHLSLTKRIDLNADTSLEFVTEAFNFPNHANLNDPDTRIGPDSSPNLNAGKIIGSTGGRVMQLGLRVLF